MLLLTLGHGCLVDSYLVSYLIKKLLHSVVTQIKLVTEFLHDDSWIFTFINSDFFNIFAVKLNIKNANWFIWRETLSIILKTHFWNLFLHLGLPFLRLWRLLSCQRLLVTRGLIRWRELRRNLLIKAILMIIFTSRRSFLILWLLLV